MVHQRSCVVSDIELIISSDMQQLVGTATNDKKQAKETTESPKNNK